MKTNFRILLFVVSSVLTSTQLHSQVLSGQLIPSRIGGVLLLPDNPSSVDNVKLSMARSCSNFRPYVGDGQRTNMVQNHITVTLGELRTDRICASLQPQSRQEIALGKLPAGTYLLTMLAAPVGGNASEVLVEKVPFTVSDARANKAAPYVALDYSGHWWDPNDGGWGLFIWQDAKSPVDSTLAAWFSYTPDGKAMWYVFQPTWARASSTNPADLLQGARTPGTTSPPSTLGAFVKAGTAQLDFTNFGTGDEGQLIYTFTNGQTLTRNIVRFRP